MFVSVGVEGKVFLKMFDSDRDASESVSISFANVSLAVQLMAWRPP